MKVSFLDMIGVVVVGVDVDVDVDVDDINVEDVAEIAKLLKQVQQAQSRGLDDEVPEEEQDHDHNKEDNNDQDNIEPVVEGENSTAVFDISPVLLAHVQRQLHNFQDLPKDQHHVNSSPDSWLHVINRAPLFLFCAARKESKCGSFSPASTERARKNLSDHYNILIVWEK